MSEEFNALLANGTRSLRSGLDYSDTFSPVVKPQTIKLELCIALSRGWSLRQIDVNHVFLHGTISEDLYMSQHPGFVHPQFPNYVCKLHKSTFRRDLAAQFTLKDLDTPHHFLGVEILPTSTSLFLTQHHYIRDLLQSTAMTDAKPVTTPMSPSCDLSTDCDVSTCNVSEYCQIGIIDHGLQLRRDSNLHLTTFCDADWASDTVDRRSTLLTELHCPLPKQPKIYSDNIGATYLCVNLVFHSRMKHLVIAYHFIRELVAAKKLHLIAKIAVVCASTILRGRISTREGNPLRNPKPQKRKRKATPNLNPKVIVKNVVPKSPETHREDAGTHSSRRKLRCLRNHKRRQLCRKEE
ncbi:hypothetical protein V8G54_026850 [Vigna mungo]|uniref:Reverse transcriptase Ty1/copia-type domain-containing protein n=1 Tax=Vigna mungo TaxID=3915 RepID=A0AAQ3RQU5_VIGMU